MAKPKKQSESAEKGGDEVYLRARCSRALKDRVSAYCENESRHGIVYQESDLIRAAVVYFLEREEAANSGASSDAKRVAKAAKKIDENPSDP